MRSLKFLLFSFLALTSTLTSSAQNTLSDRAEITLLTCGPGNELYSVFGHTAIRVYDPGTGTDIVYNFGAFDFSTPNFYAKFTRGDLQYFVTTSSYEDFVYTYVHYNRDVFEQALNLTPAQKQAIANELNNVLLDDSKRFYTYKFIHRNCTTMVADMLNKHLGQKISLENPDKGLTYREIIFSRLDNHFFENLGIQIAFGAPTDDTSTVLFLPNELMEGVGNTKTPQGPLERRRVNVYEAQGEQPFSWWNNYYAFGAVCLLLAAFSGRRPVQAGVVAVSGFMGLFLCALMLYSSHSEVLKNYNVLLLNPFAFLLLFHMVKGNHKQIVNTCRSLLVFMIVYLMFMFNKPHLFMMLPLIVLIGVTYFRVMQSAKRQLPNN